MTAVRLRLAGVRTRGAGQVLPLGEGVLTAIALRKLTTGPAP
jgi:hypothetical protein